MKKSHLALLFMTITILFIMTGFAFADDTWNGSDTTGDVTRTGNVGIGTTSPSAKLHVSNTSDSVFLQKWGTSDQDDAYYIYDGNPSNNGYFGGRDATSGNLNFMIHSDGTGTSYFAAQGGNVGIGRQNPLARLHVKDNLLLLNESTAGNTNLFINRPNSGNAQIIFGYYTGLSDTQPKIKHVSNGDLEIWNNTHFIIRNTTQKHFIVNADNGNVGIGTTTPGSYKLNVAGSVRANEIVVNTTGADYVFEDEYKLKPLEEVAEYIEKEKHLPEIPSASEMEANGVGVSEMQSKLLAKVEELTLYVIELKKENEAIKQKLEKLVN